MATAQDMITAVTTDDAARVAELVAEDPALASVARSRRACRRSCCPATGSIAARRTRCSRPIRTWTSSRRRRSATSTGCASASTRIRAEPSPSRADGFTALHFAGFFGKAEAARTLIDAGAMVDAVSRNEMRVQPLHSAAAGRHIEVCRLLIASGADVNATQQHGFTPLHAAAQHGDDELVELFLSAGADPLHGTMPATRPADIAEAAGHVDVARAAPRGRRGSRQRADRLGSAALEVALAVPGVDHRVVGLLLDPGRVEVVVDDVLAEDLDRGLGPLQLAGSPRRARAASARRPSPGSRCP